jgi:hypothetical protein
LDIVTNCYENEIPHHRHGGGHSVLMQ